MRDMYMVRLSKNKITALNLSEGEKLKLKYRDHINDLLKKGRKVGLNRVDIYTKYFHKIYRLAENAICMTPVAGNKDMILDIAFANALVNAEEGIEELKRGKDE